MFFLRNVAKRWQNLRFSKKIWFKCLRREREREGERERERGEREIEGERDRESDKERGEGKKTNRQTKCTNG